MKKETIQKTLDSISGGIAQLLLHDIFYGTLILKFKIVVTDKVPTMGVDGIHLFVNPDFVESLSPQQLRGVLAHETLHCLFFHMLRLNNRDPQIANMAMDYAINPILIDGGFQLPDGALLDRKYGDSNWEVIYEQLLNEQPPEQEPEQGTGEGGGESEPGTGDGEPQPGESSGDPGGCGEVMPQPSESGTGPASAAELAEAESEWKVAAVQAAAIQKKQGGTLPGELQKMIDELLDPKVPWLEVVNRFAIESCKNDYSYTRPNRRFISSGYYFPTLHSLEMGIMVIVIDNSCSLSQRELSQYVAEINAIKQVVKPVKLIVLYCDTQVNQVVEFGQFEDVELELLSGGGTDFRPPFKWIEDHNINPACLIYMTDMCCSRFPDEPAYPVLWATESEGYNPPFGELVTIN